MLIIDRMGGINRFSNEIIRYGFFYHYTIDFIGRGRVVRTYVLVLEITGPIRLEPDVKSLT